jgi:hypothetical protein
MLRCRLTHQFHQQDIMVYCQRRSFEHWSHLVLCRRHLVVPRFDRDPQFYRCNFEVAHISQDTILHRPEIVILQLLPFWWSSPEDRAPSHDEIGPQIAPCPIYDEVLLFTSQCRIDMRSINPRNLQ